MSGEWRQYKLRELVLRAFSGPSPDCEEIPVTGGQAWAVLKTTAITWDGWNQYANKILPRNFPVNTDLKVSQGDILITKAGPRERTGVVAHVSTVAVNVIPSGKMICFRLDPKKAVPGFVYRAIALPEARRVLSDRTTGMAESQVNFSNEVALDLELTLPPLPEQRRITEVLDTLDRTIEGTQRVIDKLQDTRQGLLHDLLTRGLDANRQLRDPERNPEQFKETELGWIPREWAVKQLFDLVISRDSERRPVKSDDRAKMQKNYPYYGASGIIDFVNNYLFDGTYVMLGEDGENILSRNLPLAFLACGRFWPNNHVHIFECTNLVEPKFMVELLEREDYTAVASGSAQPKITQGTLSVMRFACPPLTEQRAILAVLKNCDARIQGERAQLAKLQALKRGLMDDLLTGRVRVPVAEQSA